MEKYENGDYFDVIIMGGGLSGLSLAIQLRNRLSDISIAVIEKNTFPVPEATHKVGESCVELSSHYFTKVLGLKEHMDDYQLPKLGLRFFFHVNDRSPYSLEDCIEFGTKTFPPSPSYQIDRGIFENYLAELCVKKDIVIIENTKVADIALNEGGTPHRIDIKPIKGDNPSSLSCRWLVDASSRAFLIKRKLGIKRGHDHKASSAWFRIDAKIDVNDWQDSIEWTAHHNGNISRWYSTNHFMGKGYWVWFIPLASGATSIGIVTDNTIHPLTEYNSFENALAWLERHQPQCALHVRAHADKLMDFKAVKNYTHGSDLVYSPDRWYLTGEAGVFLDPFYSPGSDYIAFSNTFITNIIQADHQGKDIKRMTKVMDRLYLGLFDGTIKLYENKYQLFGTPTIMTMKYIWDTALYWGLNCLLFTQGKFEKYEELYEAYISVSDLTGLNEKLQGLFVEWSKHPQVACASSYIDLSSKRFDFFFDMNKVLKKELNDVEFQQQLHNNADTIRMLYADIVNAVVSLAPELADSYEVPEPSYKTEDSPMYHLIEQLTGNHLDDLMSQLGRSEANVSDMALSLEPS